jgi:hypothetical protein
MLSLIMIMLESAGDKQNASLGMEEEVESGVGG